MAFTIIVMKWLKPPTHLPVDDDSSFGTERVHDDGSLSKLKRKESPSFEVSAGFIRQ